MRRAKRARSVLVWAPAWQGVTQRWAASYISANKWRAPRYCGFDDLMQEAWIIYQRVEQKYPRIIEPNKFMALYKAALANWFNDRACYMKRRGTQDAELRTEPLEECLQQPTTPPPELLGLLLDEAPQELRLALELLAKQPHMLCGTPKEVDHRENLNMKLRRILGLDEKFDLAAMLTELLFN